MKNYFKELNPLGLAVFLMAELVIICMLKHDYSLAIALASLSLVELYLKGIRQWIKTVINTLILMMVFAAFNMIFYHGGDTPILYINDNPITLEAGIYGLYSGVLVSLLMLWFRVAGEFLDDKKVSWLIGSKFPVTSLIISMVFSFYHKFVYKIDKIKQVFHSFEIDEKVGKIKYAGMILSVLLSVMLEDSSQTAISMNARGYGKGKRTRYSEYKMQSLDIALMIVSICVIILRVINFTGINIVSAVFMLLPVMVCLGKELRWKYYLSKI